MSTRRRTDTGTRRYTGTGTGTSRDTGTGTSTKPSAVLSAHGIHHAFGTAVVLDGVDLSVGRGEVLGLVGPNGSGKTTLLRALTAALRPDRGEVLLHGTPVRSLGGRERARRLAVVVQESGGELPMTVADTVLLGRAPHRGLRSRPGEDREIARAALEQVGALALASRDLATLSGGERQRVLIARALVQQPEVLLLDEPTNHLDVGYQHEVLHIVRELGLSTIVVLHDLNLAARYCDRIAVLHEGRLLAEGPPAEALRAASLEEVYGVGAQELRAPDGTVQFLFHHRSSA
ncbi:ABC transporter ATP-binding protein [Brachybacterium sp. NPDC056505]|uniref:ABC transporter ATP-binding protein n=1 Tax=Brachybacterium sp. NPDC056505 TaxID=3345843 RepID=UPI00366B4375